MITLSNGCSFEYVALSGALGFDGQGWPWEKPLVWTGLIKPEPFTKITKTITFLSWEGNSKKFGIFACIRFLSGGVVNAIGMTNLGIHWWFKKIGSKIRREKNSLIASVYFGSISEMKCLATLLNEADLTGVEVNISCPNIRHSPYWQGWKNIVQNCCRFKKELRHPLLLKISVDDEIKQILPKLEGVIEAVSVNSVPWKKIFPFQKSPLAHLGGGGVSGKITQPIVWPFLAEAVKCSNIPVIASAVWGFEDLEKVRQLGVEAVGFGSVFLRYPWRPTRFVEREQGLNNKLKRAV